jgi:hypothetical protein
LPITLFHPPEGRFTNQTTTVKRGSTMFFSGSLTSIEGKLYLELHNFSFIRTQQNFSTNSTKTMPWSKSLVQTQTSDATSQTIAQKLHNNKISTTSKNPIQTNTPKKFSKPIVQTSSIGQTSGEQTWDIEQTSDITYISDVAQTSNADQILDIAQTTYATIADIAQTSDITSDISQSEIQTTSKTTPARTSARTLRTPAKTSKTPTRATRKKLSSTPALPITPNSTLKRKTRSYQTNNKSKKLADIASNAFDIADLDPEYIEVEED